MLLRVRLGAALALVLAVLACKPPVPDPAKAAWKASRDHRASEQEAYRAGFLEGAAMPPAAAQAHLRPVEPSFSPSVDELDAASGLIRWDLSNAQNEPRKQGLVDGFAWAQAHEAFHPNPIPPPPTTDAFDAWNGNAMQMRDGGWSVRLDVSGSILLWSARYKGFAPIRGWRDVSELGPLKGLALTSRTLWVDGARGLWALDLETSARRSSGPSLKLRAAAAQAEDGGLDLRALAEKGDVRAMVVMGEYAEQNGSYEEALGWYRRAAERRDAKAMEHLALMAALGRGGPANKSVAKHWLEQAQAAGDKDAAGLIQALEHPERLHSNAP